MPSVEALSFSLKYHKNIFCARQFFFLSSVEDAPRKRRGGKKKHEQCKVASVGVAKKTGEKGTEEQGRRVAL